MSAYPRKGVALVLCAPSGAGKTTLSRRIRAHYPRISFSVSCTTRPPRAGETDGEDYHFISREKFERLRDQGYFAEWASVHGNYYGTPLEAARSILDNGRDLLFDIDVQGAAQIKRSLPGAYFVFIFPPSRAALDERLHARGTESEAALAVRLANAAAELKEAGWFDAWVINDDQEQAFQDLCAVYQAASLAPERRPDFLPRLLEQF